MKARNTLWIIFIILGLVITGYNVYRLFNIYSNDTEHQAEENYEHNHDYKVTYVEYGGVTPDMSGEKLQSSFFAANNRTPYVSENTICMNTNTKDIYWFSEIDNAVYKLSGNVNVELFKKFAIGLVVYDNTLIFIGSEDDGIGGYLWGYDFQTEELTQIYDALVSSICIVNNEYYYTSLSNDGVYTQYNLLADGSSIKSDYIYCGIYQNYYLAYIQEDNSLPLLCLIDSRDNEIIPVLTNDVYISEQCIYKDTLFYRYFYAIDATDENIGDICSINLLTGEKSVVHIEEILGHSHNLSYNFINDKLYLLSENAMIEIDLVTNGITKIDIIESPVNSKVGHSNNNRLYSDGEFLYVITTNTDERSQLVSFDNLSSTVSR